MKSKDDISKRIDKICEKGEEITRKIDHLDGKDILKQIKVVEDLEKNLNELLDYIKEWNKRSNS